MKRWMVFALLSLLVLASLVWGEKRKAEAPVGPSAVLYFIADSERELTRLPVSFKRLSDDEEIRLGNSLAEQYDGAQAARGSERPEAARIIQSYVSSVGARVAAHAHRKLPYRFHYIDEPGFLNSFAVPGGHVFIGNGLIALMDSEDELAAVLGHEIEHIDHYHCAERVQLESALRKIPLGELVALPVEVFEAGYSKDEELEADREGTRLAVAASYSPLGALRMFETYDRLYGEYRAKAETPEEELAELTLQTLEGYFRSHPLPSERIALIQRMITEENWGNLTQEPPLQVAYLFWTQRAQRARKQHHYAQAARLASRSLELEPNQPEALEVLAWARFMQADFEGAAGSYRELLDKSPADANLAGRYAESLSATGDRQKASREFQHWLAQAKISNLAVATRMRVEEAGLALEAGQPAAATELAQDLKQQSDAIWVPECIGRLGTWQYRAGHYEAAAQLLSATVEQRPQETTFQVQLGWTLIAQHNYESAIQRFRAAETYRGAFPEAAMGRAVAEWQSLQKDGALTFYASAVEAEPAWRNDRWVRAVYTASVAQSVAEMTAEQQRRLEQQRRARGDSNRGHL